MSGWQPFRRLFGLDPKADVDDELSFHLEMRVKELMARGETEERARALAMHRFGDYAASRSECVAIDERRGRTMARTEYFAELRQDIGYALRSLRRRPGFTMVAIATLALGIGANSAIFSVVNGVLLRSLPYLSPQRLYRVQMLYPDGTEYSALSAPDFMSVSEHSRVFEGVGAYTGARLPLTGLGDAKEVEAALVSRDLFSFLGVTVALGRAFDGREHEPGNGTVAVLTHEFWMREFGGERSALGATLTLAGRPYTVIGVLAPRAGLPGEWEVYGPLPYDETFSATTPTRRRAEFLGVIGRARPGVDAAQVDADLKQLGARLQQEFPGSNEQLTFSVQPLRETIVGDVQRPLYVLLGAVGFVLLIACANVANLLLARASARQGELAVRAALGAGRGRLVRQLATESLVLGLLGSIGGLLVAWLGTSALVNAQPADIPRLDAIGVDSTVVLFTVALGVATGLLFGMVPALQATGRRLIGALRDGGRGGSGAAGHRLRSALIVAEMALAVVLLVGAGLLIRSFNGLVHADAGFQPEQAATFRISMQGERYESGQQARAFIQSITDELRALPGVSHVAGTSVLPMAGRGSILGPFQVENIPVPDNVNSEIAVASATPGYFDAVGARLVGGRDFALTDRDSTPAVGILNEAAVHFWFNGENPVGRRVLLGSNPVEVIGVVRDIMQLSPSEPVAPQLFLPHQQRTTGTLRMVFRTAGDPLDLARSVRQVVNRNDPNMPVTEIVPLEQFLADAVARPRFYTTLLTLFAAVALTLAGIGVFGVMSYSVAQRTREISVRMALGARSAEVVSMIVWRAMLLAGMGLLLGLLGAAALGRVISSQLFGVTLLDPITIGSVVAVLAGSAGLASYLPALRATRVEPGQALRS